MTKPLTPNELKLSTEQRPFHAAILHLASIDADWRLLVKQVGPCTHLPKPAREPYEALIRAIAYQQLHAKTGDAILTKFMALFGGSNFLSPNQILAADFDSFRACGFSGRKIETIREIASGSLSGLVPDRKDAYKMSDEDLISRLVTLKGIGPWTVEMFLIYTLERMDVLPARTLVATTSAICVATLSGSSCDQNLRTVQPAIRSRSVVSSSRLLLPWIFVAQ